MSKRARNRAAVNREKAREHKDFLDELRRQPIKDDEPVILVHPESQAAHFFGLGPRDCNCFACFAGRRSFK